MKIPPTIRHLMDSRYNTADVNDPRSQSCFLSEYGFRGWQKPGGFDRIAEMIFRDTEQRCGFHWIFDSNIVISDKTDSVWEALQRAYTLDFEAQCVLVAPVYAELAQWLEEPYRKQELAKEINRCLEQNRGFLRLFTVQNIPEQLLKVCDYYHFLISMRRFLAVPFQGLTMDGTESENKSLVMSKVAENHGQRGLMFAKDGLKSLKASDAVNTNDEAIVLMTLLYSLVKRRHVCLLTMDSHVLDIFYKLQWFIDTHYTSWLAAKKIKSGFYGVPRKSIADELAHFFEGECEIYQKKSFVFDEVREVQHNYYTFEVIYVQDNEVLHGLRYKWEPGVLEMLADKSKDGRNSVIFDQRNVHIATAPIRELGEFIVVGKDHRFFFDNPNSLPIAELDAQHALHSHETHASPSSKCVNLRTDKQNL